MIGAHYIAAEKRVGQQANRNGYSQSLARPCAYLLVHAGRDGRGFRVLVVETLGASLSRFRPRDDRPNGQISKSGAEQRSSSKDIIDIAIEMPTAAVVAILREAFTICASSAVLVF